MAFPLEAFAHGLARLRRHHEKRQTGSPSATSWLKGESGEESQTMPTALERSFLDTWRVLRSEKIDAARKLDEEIRKLDEEITFLERHPEADGILRRVSSRPEWKTLA